MEPGARVKDGKHGVFGGGDSQGLRQDLGAVIGRGGDPGKQLQRAGGTEHIEHLRKRRIKVAQKSAHTLDPKVEGQVQRVDRLLERGVVDVGQDVLRLGDKIGGTSGARIVNRVGIKLRVGNVVLKDLIHYIDIGQLRVGVLAGERERAQVRPPAWHSAVLADEDIQRSVTAPI